MYRTNNEWVVKFNQQCQSRDKLTGKLTWRGWIPFNFEYYDPEDTSNEDYMDYCSDVHPNYEICDNCRQNIDDFVATRTGDALFKKKFKYMETFIRAKFPDYRFKFD